MNQSTGEVYTIQMGENLNTEETANSDLGAVSGSGLDWNTQNKSAGGVSTH